MSDAWTGSETDDTASPRLARTFVEEHDQIDIAGRMPHSGEYGSRLGSMLHTVSDKMHHRLPHDAPMRAALGRDIIELNLESLVREAVYKFHQQDLLLEP